MLNLPKKRGVKVRKMCVNPECGHMEELAASAMVNCPKCHKASMRTAYGDNGEEPRIVED